MNLVFCDVANWGTFSANKGNLSNNLEYKLDESRKKPRNS